MKASDYIAEFFNHRGINVIFGYIGGMITHIVDSIDRNNNVKFVQTYHEQSAAIAAEGYALESGRPGVAIVTSGPGVTNLLTGIADAYMGSIPVIYISGQVNTYEYKYNKPIRQQGFQELDVISMVKPITKYAKFVDDADMLPYELEKAYSIAMQGNKGPVLLDIPMNVTRAEINPYSLPHYTPSDTLVPEIDESLIDKCADLILNSKHPMVLIGGGAQGASDEVADFLNSTGIPYVTSLIGKSVVSESTGLCMGLVGSYGNRCANMAVSQCDVLIALGSRLDTRQTGARLDAFMPEGTIIHVNIDKDELDSHRLKNRISVNSDVGAFILALQSKIGSRFVLAARWKNWLADLKKNYSQNNEIKRFVKNKHPYLFVERLNEITKPYDVVTVDIGQNQMWVAQTLHIKEGMEFVTSGGLAPMGFSLPTAIGIAFASPEKRIFCIVGDGSLQISSQSLLLISQYNLNIKVILLNNKSLGMITQFQQLYFDGNLAASTYSGGYILPDFGYMAKCYRLPYFQHIAEDEYGIDINTLKEIMVSRNLIFDYLIEGLTEVSPKLEFDKPIYNPSPYIDSDELHKVMNSF